MNIALLLRRYVILSCTMEQLETLRTSDTLARKTAGGIDNSCAIFYDDDSISAASWRKSGIYTGQKREAGVFIDSFSREWVPLFLSNAPEKQYIIQALARLYVPVCRYVRIDLSHIRKFGQNACLQDSSFFANISDILVLKEKEESVPECSVKDLMTFTWVLQTLFLDEDHKPYYDGRCHHNICVFDSSHKTGRIKSYFFDFSFALGHQEDALELDMKSDFYDCFVEVSFYHKNETGLIDFRKYKSILQKFINDYENGTHTQILSSITDLEFPSFLRNLYEHAKLLHRGLKWYVKV